MKATIIGAGIGGLTTAIALKQRGIEVEIFEATEAFKKVGAGIVIAINSMQIMRRLGLDEKIEAGGIALENMQITDAQLKPISEMKADFLEQNFGFKNVALHRATLHEILLSELADIPLHLNKKVKHIEQKEGVVTVAFEDGSSHQTNLLIGADGIHSAVRKTLFPKAKERNPKQICWRGVSTFDLGKGFHQVVREAWGVNERFGIVPIAPNTVYWFACAGFKEDSQREFGEKKLQDVFSKFDPLVTQIIASTPKDKIITADLSDLEPLPTWYQGNIVLMGDAAHATTPNMGQGANQAIESAWVLADCLDKENDLSQAFSRYQKIRQKKANEVVQTSWQIGKIAHVSSPFVAKVRNASLSIMPNFLAKKQMKKLFTLPYLETRKEMG